MPGSTLSIAEQALLTGLITRNVRFMIVGMSAALLRAARGVMRAAGGVWISGAFGMGPPRIGGDALSERFDVVMSMTGLGAFAEEVSQVRYEEVDGIRLSLLDALAALGENAR